MHGGVRWGLWALFTCTLLLKPPTTQIARAEQRGQIYTALAAAECVKSEKSAARAEKIQFLINMKGINVVRVIIHSPLVLERTWV